MNRLLTALLLFNIASADPVDPFSGKETEFSVLSRFELLESRVQSHRVITFEEIECLPEDATAADIMGVFGSEGAVAPENPFSSSIHERVSQEPQIKKNIDMDFTSGRFGKELNPRKLELYASATYRKNQRESY